MIKNIYVGGRFGDIRNWLTFSERVSAGGGGGGSRTCLECHTEILLGEYHDEEDGRVVVAARESY